MWAWNTNFTRSTIVIHDQCHSQSTRARVIQFKHNTLTRSSNVAATRIANGHVSVPARRRRISNTTATWLSCDASRRKCFVFFLLRKSTRTQYFRSMEPGENWHVELAVTMKRDDELVDDVILRTDLVVIGSFTPEFSSVGSALLLLQFVTSYRAVRLPQPRACVERRSGLLKVSNGHSTWTNSAPHP